MSLIQNFGFFLITLLFGNCTNHQNNIIFEDFEGENFSKWEVQGTAFDKPYLADTITNTSLKNSVMGSKFAYSYINDTILNQGKLISPKFEIKHKYIDFLIGGGQHSTRMCVNLLINNKIVRTQSGYGSPVLSKVNWDVSEYIGQNAIIEIVDAMHYSYNDLDYLMVDNIVFSDHKPRPTVVFEDFESGTFKHWLVEGNAFKSPGNRSNIYYPITVNGFQGKYFAFSFGENHDKETGRLLSEKFIIDRNYISFLVGGGNHPDTTCIRLLVDDSVYFSETGLSTGDMRKEIWNVNSLLGQEAQIEILDDYDWYWGHIIVDDIRFVDVLDETVESIPYHKSRIPLVYGIGIFIVVCLLVLTYIYLLKRKTKVEPHSISDKDFQKAMLNLLENDKVFIKSDLSAAKVAQIINIPDKDVLEKTEATFKTSFNDLINEYRINYFKQEVLKSENKELKLVAIAEKCGFNSKSSFYRIFKRHTNQTPTDYLQGVEKKKKV